MSETAPLTVVSGDEETTIYVGRGRNLREVLLEQDFPVYGSVSKYANCGGRASVRPAPSR